jgi:hypothetical protein
MPGWPRTYVPIVPYPDRCDHKCCATIQVILRPCKAITIHKSQRQFVGPSEVWKHIFVELVSAPCCNKTPDLECVTFSIATALECLAVLDDNEITYDMIMKIGKGKGKAYHKQHYCELQLRALSRTRLSRVGTKL